MTTFRIAVDVDAIEGAADALNRIVSGQRLGLATLQAVNTVTAAFVGQAIEGGLADINLQETYVRSKTDLFLGTNPSAARAEIVTRAGLSTLGRYGASQQSMYPGFGVLRRAGPRVGRRNAGVRVSIRRLHVSDEPQWFVLRLRAGREPGDRFGVFVRDDSIAPSASAAREGKAGKRHIYGPSPAALFRRQTLVQGPRLQSDLRERVLAGLVKVVDDAFVPAP